MAVASSTTTIPRARWQAALVLALAIAAIAGPAAAQGNDLGDNPTDDPPQGDFSDDVFDEDDTGMPAGDLDTEPLPDPGSAEEERGAAPTDRDDAQEPTRPGPSSTPTPNVPMPSAGDRAPRQTRFFQDLSVGLPSTEITAVAVDPGDPEVHLVGTDGFVFKTDDGGESWRPTLSFARGLASDLLLDDGDDDGTGNTGPDLLVQDRNIQPVDENDLQRSPDTTAIPMLVDPNGGLPQGDFDPDAVAPTRAEGVGVRKILFVSSSEGTVYVAGPRGCWRSVDGGETWQRLLLPGLPANDVRDLAVHPDRPSRVWLATRGGLYVTPDGGATFDIVATGGRSPAISVETATVLGQPVVVVGTSAGLWRSWDDGETFRKLLLQGVSPNEPVGALAIDAGAAVFYAGTPSGLFVAERRVGILERRPLFNNLEVAAVSVDPLRPRGAAIGTTAQGLVITEDTGLSTVPLREIFPAATARSIARRGDDPDALIVATPRGVFIHKEGSGLQVTTDRYRRLQELFMREPTLAELVDQALRHQRVHPERMGKIEERTRLRALAPQVTLLYRLTWGRPEEQQQYVLVGDEPDDYDDRNEQDVQELYDLGILVRAPQVGLNHRGWIYATWYLDQFIFTPYETFARNHRNLQRREERRVAGQVQQLFTARRRLILEMLEDGQGADVAARTRRQLRLHELTALLDGASGGAFSRISQDRGADLEMLSPRRSR